MAGWTLCMSAPPMYGRGSEASPDLRRARDLVRRGGLGEVVFCRMLQDSVAEAAASLRFLFDGAAPVSVAAQEDGRGTLRYAGFVASCETSKWDEIVLCGTQATLVVNRGGLRLHRRPG